MSASMWTIAGYGTVQRENAVWLRLVELRVVRSGKAVLVAPDGMRVGEEAVGIFRGGGVSRPQARRAAAVKQRAQTECAVVREA